MWCVLLCVARVCGCVWCAVVVVFVFVYVYVSRVLIVALYESFHIVYVCVCMLCCLL